MAITLTLEHSLRVHRRRSLGQVGIAIVALFLNQICFVYALEFTTATTVSLLIGTMPIIAGLLGTLTGLEHVPPVLARGRRFRHRRRPRGPGLGRRRVRGPARDPLGARDGRDLGCLLGRRRAAHAHVLAVRISTLVIGVRRSGWPCIGAGQLADQDFDFGWLVWLGLAFAVVGPLVLTTVLWFTAVHRVGPARATLVVNLQPFIGAMFAVILLSEPLSALQVAGGALIAVGLLLAGRRGAIPAPAE